MAAFTNTDIVYAVAGGTGVGKFNREDLSDLVTNISPTDRPFVTRIGKGTAKAVLHEWMSDVLRAAAENAQVEGDEYTYNTNSSGTRVSTNCQILRDTIIVSGTLDAVDKAGMKKWMAYQVAKTSKELANDLEWMCLNNTATVADANGSTARKSEGVCSNGTAHTGYIYTNVIDKDGAISQTDINVSMQDCWTEGGKPTFALMGAFNKRTISGWTTGVVKNLDASKHVLTSYVDVYETDFGPLELVLDHFIPTDAIYMIEPRHWSIDYLRPLQVKNPSETGDATKYAVLMECCLVCRAEKANAAIVDTSTS